MQRRIALALSLAFTTLVTFGIIVVGAQAGFFSEHTSAKAAQPAPAAVWTGDAAPADAAASEEDPLVVTDYIYVDQTAVPVGVRVARAAAPRPATPTPAAQSKQRSQPSTSVPDGDSATTPKPASTQPATPTHAAPTAPQPIEPPAATSTPAVPTSTPKPATPISVPAQPSPAGQPQEIEFVGRVTSISGDIVTFLHNGVSTPVKVTLHLSSLNVGTTAHVHAVLSGGIYVATEIEVGD